MVRQKKKDESTQLVEAGSMQLLAWYRLQRLLREQWNGVFKPWHGPLRLIEGKLHGHKKYLRVKYEDKAPYIAKLKEEGVQISQCINCHFQSAAHRTIVDGYRDIRCLVCNDLQHELDILCPTCGSEQTLHNDLILTCGECGNEATIQEIRIKAQPKPTHKHDDIYYNINCCRCHESASVIVYDHYYVCLNCLYGVQDISICEYCNEGINRPLKNSFFLGCGFCEGKEGTLSD